MSDLWLKPGTYTKAYKLAYIAILVAGLFRAIFWFGQDFSFLRQDWIRGWGISLVAIVANLGSWWMYRCGIFAGYFLERLFSITRLIVTLMFMSVLLMELPASLPVPTLYVVWMPMMQVCLFPVGCLLLITLEICYFVALRRAWMIDSLAARVS